MSKLIYVDRLKKDILDLQNCYNGFSDTYDKACIIGVIDEQPTIEERKWIPCSERLPDGRLNKSYLVQDKDGRRAVGTYTNWGWMFGYYMNDPVAWMPLPEPYEEGAK